jgi:hypothetical protein
MLTAWKVPVTPGGSPTRFIVVIVLAAKTGEARAMKENRNNNIVFFMTSSHD